MKFNLKSGYCHLDVFEVQQPYHGSCVFMVLPFGSSILSMLCFYECPLLGIKGYSVLR